MTEHSRQGTDRFSGIDQPPTLRVRALDSAELTASRLIWAESKIGIPTQFENKDGYLVCLQRLDLPAAPHWIDGRSVARPPLYRGQTVMADLNQEHSSLVHAAVDCVSLYASRDALERFQAEHDLPRITSLRASPDLPLDDDIIRNLCECLLPAFDRPEATSQLFVDHVALALLAHLTARYGSQRAHLRPIRGGLAPWQERRAKEILLARIDGKVGLDELARACGLSRSHFARAFKTTTGVSPLQWLLAQRIERAKTLLLNSNLPIDQVAHGCGFTDQSHFTRAFLKAVKVTPGRWRRDRRY